MRNYSFEDWKYHIKDWVTHKALFSTNFSKINPSTSKSLLTDSNSNSNNDQIMYKTEKYRISQAPYVRIYT